MTITLANQTPKADGVKSIASQTDGFTFNHTMLRVKTLPNHLSFIQVCLG